MAFLCWGSDHEDLTAQVEALIDGDPLPVVEATFAGGRRRARPWTVTVICSEGHVNIFSGAGRAGGELDGEAR